MGIRVMKSGLQSTIQDLGRYCYQQYGMPVSGAMDTLALRLGNIILTNAEDEAAIECTLIGPSLFFEENQLICITGANLFPKLNDNAIQMWKPIFVQKGDILSFENSSSNGSRSYICFYGGLNIPVILGSKSTYQKANIGGWKGRALKIDDRITFLKPYNGIIRHFNWSLDTSVNPIISTPLIRVVEGPQLKQFEEMSVVNFFDKMFSISNQSDRMGFRLESEPILLKEKKEILSSAVTFGTIQVPAHGQLIILMADHGTTGGYPVIAVVASIDLPLLAQKKFNDKIQFEWISLKNAQKLMKEQNAQLNKLKIAIRWKYES